MIDLSRLGREQWARAALMTSLVCASAAAMSCNALGAGCDGPSCDPTLRVGFQGNLSPGEGPYDGGLPDGGVPPDAIQIDIEVATRTKPAFDRVRPCWFIRGDQDQVVCEQGSDLYRTTGFTFSSDVTQLRVTMSKAGVLLSEQTISPTYTTARCGCGDATASHGTVTITLPGP